MSTTPPSQEPAAHTNASQPPRSSAPRKSDAVVKLLLVFFVSLLSFAVGTYVGKKYSDKQYKTAQLEPKNHIAAEKQRALEEANGGEAETAAAESHHDESKRSIASENDKEAMTDDEIARLAEEYVKDDEPADIQPGHGETHAQNEHGKKETAKGHGAPTVAQGHEQAKADNHGKKNVAAAAHSEIVKQPILAEDNDSHKERVPASPSPKAKLNPMNENVEQNHKPELANPKAPKRARVPSSLPENPIQSSIGKFTVQVASFASESEAKDRATNLRNEGFNAFYVQANVKGRNWFRVSIGLFTTEREAKTYLEKYRKSNAEAAAIIQKISAE